MLGVGAVLGAVLAAGPLPKDCVTANGLLGRYGTTTRVAARLPTRKDITGRWREFVEARKECPYARRLLINDDATPDLAVLLPAKAAGHVIAVLLSDGDRYSVQLVERGDAPPQERGVVYSRGTPGVFHVDFGERGESFRWDPDHEVVVKVVIPRLFF